MKSKKIHKQAIDHINIIIALNKKGFLKEEQANTMLWAQLKVTKKTKMNRKKKSDIIEKGLLALLIVNNILNVEEEQ